MTGPEPTPTLPNRAPSPPAGPGRGGTRVTWSLSPVTRALVTSLLVALAIGVLGTFVKVPYVVTQPGSAFNALGSVPGGQSPMITVSGAPSYPADGALDVTTVALYGGPGHDLNVWDWVRFKVAGAEFEDRERYYPTGVTGEQVTQWNRAEMVGSQQEAVAVALRATGRSVTEQVIVAGVDPKGPAGGRLRPGDQLTAVNGTTIVYLSDVSRLIQRAAPRAAVRLGILRDGVAETVSLTPTTERGRRLLRVNLGSRFTYPVNVTINAGDVGGPSAGLVFSLAVYDKLTPGSLTGGKQIAGTGEIASDGAVGPIGGIEHKLVGAREAGASWFLAPASNCSGVTGHVPDGLRVVKVSTFVEAKTAVERIAAGTADGLPGC